MAAIRKYQLVLRIVFFSYFVCRILAVEEASERLGGKENLRGEDQHVPEMEETEGAMTTFELFRDSMEEFNEDFQEGIHLVRERALQVKEQAFKLQEKFTDVVDEATLDVREYLGLEKPYLEQLEDRMLNVLQETAFARQVIVKGCVGLSMVLYGMHFSHLVVFIHTLRVTGLPVMQRAWNEFVDMYGTARRTIKREYPNMLHTKKLLQAVHYEIQSTRKLLHESAEAAKDGKVTESEAREAVRKAKLNLRELNEKSWILNQAFSSMHAVAAAIDFVKIKDLFSGIYTSALACFATASSSTLRGLSIGFDLASLISQHIDHAVQAVAERIPRLEVLQYLPRETQKLLGMTVSLVSVLKGLIVVHFVVPRLTLVISSSALGALWVTDMLVDVMDAGADGPGTGLLNDKCLYLLSNFFWTAVGCMYQSHREGQDMPRLIQVLLFPAVRLETLLCSLDNFLGSSREKIEYLVKKHTPFSGNAMEAQETAHTPSLAVQEAKEGNTARERKRGGLLHFWKGHM